MNRHSTDTYPSVPCLAASLRSIPRRVCQWMNATVSQKAVVTKASDKYSQAKASPRMSNQRSQAKTAGTADGEVSNKVRTPVCKWLTSDVGMAVVTGAVCLATLLADGFVSTVLAIALCACAVAVLVVAWMRTAQGVK